MIRGLATLALMLAPLPVLAQAGLADVRPTGSKMVTRTTIAAD